jgi:hypothetical protein
MLRGPAFAVSIGRERLTPHVRKLLAFGEIELASSQLIGTVPQSSFSAFLIVYIGMTITT